MSLKVTTRLAAPLFAVSLIALTACGGSSRTAGTAPAGADLTVRAKDGLQWNAKSFTATSTDGKVEIFAVNDSSLAHNLHIVDKDDKDVITGIDLSGSGASNTVTVDLAPGEYTIVCKVPGHSSTMHATLTVS